MLLGSGELGKEVIISAQRLGCEVIAVDRYNNAPGMQVADKYEVINNDDFIAFIRRGYRYNLYEIKLSDFG